MVTTPAEGFSGWFDRLMKIFGAHWRSMYAIGLLTYGIPTALLTTLLAVYSPTTTQRLDENGRTVVDTHFPHVGAFLVVLLVLVVVAGFLSALGHAALVWTITRRSAGAPAALGAALRYGLRNSFRLWGWSLLYALLAGLGIIACFVGSLYVALAGCLYLPIALYQRGANPISTSFGLIHKNFGAALGRMALLLLLTGGASLILRVPATIVTMAAGRSVGYLVSVAVILIGLPINMGPLVGEVLLFAELTARKHPLSSADLNAVL